MEKTQLYLNAISTTIIIATLIITFFAILILHAIKRYNMKALGVQLEYEDYKIRQEKLLLETEIEIQEQTFQLISKEIHDNITQSLSLANLTLNCIQVANQPEVERELIKSRLQIAKALNDLNNLSKSLDVDLIQSHGLAAAIQFEIERWNRLFDTTINLKIFGELQHLDKTIELFVFRIVQESINNAIKYANGKTIYITLEYRENEIILKVEDDGKGFDYWEFEKNKIIGRNSGIKNMKQRANLLDGNFSIITAPGKGTKIITSIPKKNAV